MSENIFRKVFSTPKELMEITNIPESTFYKFQNEWIKKGGDPKDMGKVEVDGGPTLWNGPKYVEWLTENKINKEKALLIIKQSNKREDHGDK